MKKSTRDCYRVCLKTMVGAGYAYRIYDWQEVTSVLDYLALASHKKPICIRIVDMGDDAYHVVSAPFFITNTDARAFIRLALMEE